MDKVFWYKINNRKKKCLGALAAKSEKEAVEKWYKSGMSRFDVVNAELYGYADKERKMEIYEPKNCLPSRK